MFERILSKSDLLAVLFYSEKDCKNCDKVLKELENVRLSDRYPFLILNLAFFIEF